MVNPTPSDHMTQDATVSLGDGGTALAEIDVDLLSEMAPVAQQLYERHLRRCKHWYPHEHVPWGEGTDFSPGERIEEFQLPDAVRSSTPESCSSRRAGPTAGL